MPFKSSVEPWNGKLYKILFCPLAEMLDFSFFCWIIYLYNYITCAHIWVTLITHLLTAAQCLVCSYRCHLTFLKYLLLHETFKSAEPPPVTEHLHQNSRRLSTLLKGTCGGWWCRERSVLLIRLPHPHFPAGVRIWTDDLLIASPLLIGLSAHIGIGLFSTACVLLRVRFFPYVLRTVYIFPPLSLTFSWIAV